MVVCLFCLFTLFRIFPFNILWVALANDKQQFYWSLSDIFYSKTKVNLENNNLKNGFSNNEDSNFKLSAIFVKNNKNCQLDKTLALAKKCTFLISADQNQGSAFAIAPNLILTNFHVIKGVNSIVTFIDGQLFPLQLVNFSEKYDIAVLKIDKKVDFCLFYSVSNLELAENLYVFGWSYGFEGESMITKGVFSRLINTKNDGSFVQSDALVGAGNSGGPLVSACGVVGMNTVKFFTDENLTQLNKTFTLSLSSDFINDQLGQLLFD